MNIFGLLPIIIGILAILNRKAIIDYSDKLNQRNNRPTNTQILEKRLLIGSTFIIILGIINLSN